MAVFQMHFESGEEGPELAHTVFEHASINQRLTAVRGKTEGALRGSGTFQWTPAVRALAILIIRTKENSLRDIVSYRPVLQSSSRGAVSALDYAVSRNAHWITDMFGVDSQGRPLSKRILRRSNPERKRPGPLAISLNEKFIDPSQIEIYHQGTLLADSSGLEQFIALITDQSSSSIELSQHIPSKNVASSVFGFENLRSEYIRELRLMLRATDIFSKRALRNALHELQDISALSSIVKKMNSDLEEIDLSLISSDRLGRSLSASEYSLLFPNGAPLKFGVTPSQIGTLTLLRYLRDVRKLPIEIDYSFFHTSDISRGIESGGNNAFPQCCVMTTASYALLPASRRKQFTPLMVMPAATHSILGAGGASDPDCFSRSAEYHFLSEFPTTPRFWFDTLQKRGVIKHQSSKLLHTEPDEALQALQSGDPNIRAILWFPYNLIAQSVTGVSPLLQAPYSGSGLGFIQNILFVDVAWSENKSRRRLLDMLIRDAWLALMHSEQACAELIDSQLQEKAYCENLWRYSGMYRFQAITAPSGIN